MSRLRRGSPALIRDLNRSAVLALIGSQGPVARVEIARRLSLSAATVTEVTRELVTEGLIRVVDQAASSGGRRPLLLGLVAEAAHALGVKVSPDRIAIVEVNLDGDILTQNETPIDALGPEALGRLVKVLRRRSRRPTARAFSGSASASRARSTRRPASSTRRSSAGTRSSWDGRFATRSACRS